MYDISPYLRDVLTTYLNQDQAALAIGITFGIKDLFTPEFYQQTKIIGVTHMMVLSGANISMFIAFIQSLLNFVKQKWTVIIAIFFVIILLSIIPIQSSIIRAAIMSFASQIGLLIGKRVHRMYLLLFTSGLMIGFDTTILNEISFQLSFLAVFGITLFQNEIIQNDKNKNIVQKIIYAIKDQMYMGLSAQTFTVPLIFYYFGNISLLSIFANLALSPFVSPVMILTILITIMQQTIPEVSQYISAIMSPLLDIMVYIIKNMAQLEFTYIQY
ncbi:MAG TPA: ComEC/Rec2 family competence protein [Candidatus Woesebacteria bacterium]|nr:ComEC/Rec2 family competence protein [Candidatus Woesebacteria bacterium]HNS94856.1 ComEC/Rec2 family competence protein [Candidatus Woesebacteria bacterium]